MDRNLHAMRILVVDDESDLADAIAAGLRREGYAVDVANDGQGALDRLAVNAYDLVTLDLNLPDVDGREICRLIRTDSRFDPETRVLMGTGRDSVDDRVAGLDDGADDYLVKPFAMDELEARLRALARRRGARLLGPSFFAILIQVSAFNFPRVLFDHRRPSRLALLLGWLALASLLALIALAMMLRTSYDV